MRAAPHRTDQAGSERFTDQLGAFAPRRCVFAMARVHSLTRRALEKVPEPRPMPA